MMVTLLARDPCWLCGYLGYWHQVVPVRVNKKSLQTTGRALGASPSQCRECGAPYKRDTYPDRWRLDPESQEKVDGVKRHMGTFR